MTQKIVLIGAGSANFGLEAVSDIYRSKTLEGSDIVLHDTDEKSLKETQAVADKYKGEFGVNFNVTSSTNRKEALKGATVIVISIEVAPRFGLWDQDWKIPQQYGIKQIYAENGGPGGLFHSLRIIPPILDICEDINNICPEAYVYNFSNPMQRICHAVSVKFPAMKLNNVVFPEPLGPIIPVMEPFFIFKEHSETAASPPKYLESLSTLRIF